MASFRALSPRVRRFFAVHADMTSGMRSGRLRRLPCLADPTVSSAPGPQTVGRPGRPRPGLFGDFRMADHLRLLDPGGRNVEPAARLDRQLALPDHG